MKKIGQAVIFIIAGIVLIAGAFMSSQQARSGSSAPVEHLTIVSKNGTKHDFEVEIAKTPVDREVGLMFRKEMAPDHGMLFEMDETAVTRFWMKNTLIPLDMLFIAPDGTIKTIEASAEPETLNPRSSEVPVNGVLELNGGRAKALNIAPGDKVEHPFFTSSKTEPRK